MNHRFGFSTSGNPTKHMPIGYWSLWGQPRSVTSGDLRWPWNSCDASSRVTDSHLLALITSTNPIQVNRATPSCVYSRFRWNLAEGCSLCDDITSWLDLTWPNFFHQKLRKGRPISYRKFQHDTPNGLACSSEKVMGGLHQPPLHWRGLTRALLGGGAFERPPPPLRFFEASENTAARSAAGFSPTLPPIFSATFVKI